MFFGPGVSNIDACWDTNITLVWNGTHDLVETQTAACDSNITQVWLGPKPNGYEQTFTNLGGQFRGQTRYFKSTLECAVDNARFEVFCPHVVEPDRRITVNTSGSDLELPAVIVGLAVTAFLSLVLAWILCPRPKRRKKKYTTLSTIAEEDEEDEQAELGEPKLIY